MSDDEPLVACKRCQLAQRVLKQQTQIITDLERCLHLAERQIRVLEEQGAEGTQDAQFLVSMRWCEHGRQAR